MNWEFIRRHSYLFVLLFLANFNTQHRVFAQFGPVGGGIPQGVNQPLTGGGGSFQQPNIGPNDNPNVFSGTGNNLFYGVNLVPFGPENGDHKVSSGFLTSGETIDLYMYFPFYGGLYNYTTLSVNGYMAFATVLDQGPTINVGPDATDWPRQQDPAMIAPYLCKQQIAQDGNVAMRAGVYYRLIMRQSMFGRGSNSNINQEGNTMPESSIFGQRFQSCPGTGDNYVRCDANGDFFLDQMMRSIQDGVAGGTAFRADAALVVTWYNTASALSGRADIDAGQLATYQVVWLTDQAGRLSYVILNYDKLGFDAADIRMNSRSGRCQALFNGGNHTGMVLVDPTQNYKNTPKVLAQRSGLPHVVRGRYMFRVDDVVRPGGCSNKTGGTYPMMIYPNIVNMLGEMTVDVNAICLDRTQTYILMIEQRQTATCVVLNAAIARCNIPKIYDWGTKTVYFQPQSSGANEEKAFVGYIYFVPPTLDPMRLDIGNIYDWYKNPMQYQVMPISWFPRNFTNPDLNYQDQNNMRISDDQMYGVQLGLYVIGYTEFKDNKIKKFRPEHRVLCRLATYSNRNTYEYRFNAQKERINVGSVERWYLNEWEQMNKLYEFRVGYLKLAPLRSSDQELVAPTLLSGLVSAPISLHWLWTTNNVRFDTTTFSRQESDSRADFVVKKATEMCHDWYDEDGAQWNFIRDTETNASCPCMESQAKYDLGRFMPHPRCSQTFRDITCTSMIGAKNCYMSASNVYGSYGGSTLNYGHNNYDYGTSDGIFGPQNRPSDSGGGGFGYGNYGRDQHRSTSSFPTHYGQVCCYDEKGFLQQTTYQPVIKVIEETPYNPGFPLRAYEFGTSPYMGQFEVPGLSSFHHDYLPYFLCCKFAKFRCQLFYWRRPSSGCQQYQPPAIGKVIGAGTFNTIDNDKFIFNEPGVYNLLYISKTTTTPEVKIQIRMEKYPNRRVDFSMLGRHLSQEQLVKPTNVTVITGIAIEATGTDRVHVLARGDTRRFRYRTSVIVGSILRYFDTMRLQRFKGVLIYVNNVERGQPEIYVVLEEAQVGIRIRESYSLDIDRMPMYQESMGMLDIAISVPPQYGVRPDGDKTREQENRQRYDLPHVGGLIRPFPEMSTGTFYQTLSLSDVNSESIRPQLVNMYKLHGSGDRAYGNPPNVLNQYMPTDNMFTTPRDEDKKFSVFPEAVMVKEPIYKTAELYNTQNYHFVPNTGVDLMSLLTRCLSIQESNQISLQPLQGQIFHDYANVCPDNPGKIIAECGDNVPCLYDYAMLNAEVLGNEAKDAWNSFSNDRISAIRQYNSCGPINIEYPEYMMKASSLSSSYLQGDTARFECFQSHWIKGDYEFKCAMVVDYNNPNNYRFEWNKGSQPWCRSREMHNFLNWLSGILITIGILTTIILIFLCCWCTKIRRQQEREKNRPDNSPLTNRFQKENYDFDSMPRKTNSLNSLNQMNGNFKRNPEPSPPRNAENGRKLLPETPYTSPSRTPETPDIRSRFGPQTSRTGPPSDEEARLIGLNTSV